MLAHISDLYQAIANGRNVLILSIATLAFILLTIPIAEAAAAGLNGLDARGIYTLQEAHAFIAANSPADPHALRLFYLCVDLIIPLLYASSIALLISWLRKKTRPVNGHSQLLNLLPLLAIPFDYLENISILRLYMAVPAQPNDLARLAILGSRGKFIVVSLSALIVLYTFLARKRAFNK
jgi:hypothetical protein